MEEPTGLQWIKHKFLEKNINFKGKKSQAEHNQTCSKLFLATQTALNLLPKQAKNLVEYNDVHFTQVYLRKSRKNPKITTYKPVRMYV